MSATTKLKWKKLITQLKYMYEELDIVKTMSNEAAAEFQEHYENYCTQNGVDREALNAQHKDRLEKLYPNSTQKQQKPKTIPEYSGSTALSVFDGPEHEKPQNPETQGEQVFTSQDDKDLHEVFSKLFRKLATVLHPDKLNNSNYSEEKKEEMSGMFATAKAALEERKYFILIDYAEHLKVPTPKNYKQQISWMKKEAESVRKEIAAVTRTYNYSFAEAETDEQKDILIKRFIKQVFGYTVPDKH